MLGDNFLRNAYLVYDPANNEISMAPTKFDEGAGEILEIAVEPPLSPESLYRPQHWRLFQPLLIAYSYRPFLLGHKTSSISHSNRVRRTPATKEYRLFSQNRRGSMPSRRTSETTAARPGRARCLVVLLNGNRSAAPIYALPYLLR